MIREEVVSPAPPASEQQPLASVERSVTEDDLPSSGRQDDTAFKENRYSQLFTSLLTAGTVRPRRVGGILLLISGLLWFLAPSRSKAVIPPIPQVPDFAAAFPVAPPIVEEPEAAIGTFNQRPQHAPQVKEIPDKGKLDKPVAAEAPIKIEKPVVKAQPPLPPRKALPETIVDAHLEMSGDDIAIQSLDGETLGDLFRKDKALRTDQKEKATGKLKEGWVDGDSGPSLLFDSERVVGIQKIYMGSVDNSTDLVKERFGDTHADTPKLFDSVKRMITQRQTGGRLLIRYCFEKSIAYAYIADASDSINGRGAFLLVAVFDRKWLRELLIQDLTKKESILRQFKPCIDLALTSAYPWPQKVLPEINGGRQVKGTVAGRGDPFYAVLGRRAVADIDGISEEAVRVVFEKTNSEKRTAFKIAFNCIPTFDVHPLTSARYLAGRDQWFRSLGQWHVEHTSQECLLALVQAIWNPLPSSKGDLSVKTVDNPVIDPFETFAHKSMFSIQYFSKPDLRIRLNGNNSVVFTKVDRVTIR